MYSPFGVNYNYNVHAHCSCLCQVTNPSAPFSIGVTLENLSAEVRAVP